MNENYYRYKRILFSFYNEEGEALTDAEKEQARTQASALLAELKGKTETEFEAAALEKNGTDEYTDGYYLPKNASIGNNSEEVAFFSAITEKLGTMEVGEIALLELSDGIQILRRYEPTSGAYDMSVNSIWFSSFASNLMASLFEKECKNYTDRITIDETVLAEAPKIKEIEPNYYF